MPTVSAEYPPISMVATYPTVPKAEKPPGWRERNSKNKPQSNSVGATCFIFTSGGMFIVGPAKATDITTKDLEMSWFIGGFMGAIIGAILCNRIPKKSITCFAALLVVISGILLIADSPSYDAMMSARYLNGIALGLVFPLTFVLAGEEAVKSIRGIFAAATDSMCFTLGVFLQMIYMYMWPDIAFNGNQMMGVFCLIWGCVSFLMAYSKQIESPVFHLARGREELAIDTLRRLQRPFIVTHETFEQLEEHKRYLAESKERTFVESARNGWPALVKLCFYRSVNAWSLSFYTNFAFAHASSVAYPNSVWSYCVYGVCRWIGAGIAVFMVDFKGRKPPLMVGTFGCCCLTIAVGGICDANISLNRSDRIALMAAAMYLLMLYQFFAGLSTATSSAYLSEAFPLAVKPHFIGIVFMCEMLVHLITIACRTQTIPSNVAELPAWFYSVGALTLVFFVVTIVAMPETKSNSLRECLVKFGKIFNDKVK